MIGRVVGFLIILAAGLVPFGLGVYGIYRKVITRGWPVTEAVASDAAIIPRKGRRQERVVVTLDYRVEGRGYQHQMRRTATRQYPSSARGFLERYPAGETFKIRYRPKDPSDMVMHPGHTIGIPLALLGTGFLFILASLGVLLLRRRVS